jgi:hypothetical protein
MMNDEKLKSNSKELFMPSLIIHNSSFIISLKPPSQKLFISNYVSKIGQVDGSSLVFNLL